ncbi:DUF4030 domain-containing protein [Lentibacillus sp. Marseille-P4043]|uniref:DUF4030 domain-containing protein n=1 Tax=Lentibacillus sp. Marseille-P4043 TaxID=2040293 RepID=UPI000D0B6B8B|nr:DUF4030 domain-containing protein [Lentibacillus sp. Marseille-P4043]
MDEKFKKMKDYYNNNYFKQETAERIKKGVFNEIRNKKANSPVGKKLMYFSSAIVLLFGVLIGAAFVSPSVAKVLAQIPVLNSLFEKDSSSSLGSSIIDTLEELDYNIGGSFLDVREKTIGVSIKGSESYFNEVKGDVEQEIEGILHEKGLDAYHVEVGREKENVSVENEISDEQRKKIEGYMKKSKNLENAILNELDKQNYDIISAHVRINKIEKFIPLEIPVSETRVEEIKQIVNNIVEKKNLGDFKIKIYKIDPEKEEADRRWTPVITTITEGLIGMEGLKVEGVGYSFYPSPLTLSIRTSIDSSDSNAKELGNEIERTVRQFIESNEVAEIVKDDPYKINVYNKDKEKIN